MCHAKNKKTKDYGIKTQCLAPIIIFISFKLCLCIETFTSTAHTQPIIYIPFPFAFYFPLTKNGCIRG